MSDMTPKSAAIIGAKNGSPFILVLLPFAVLFGVLANQAGLSIQAALGFSFLVIAGSAQFAALQLLTEDAAIPLILLASLSVNLRMAMYSASLVPHLGKAPIWQRALVAYLNFDQAFAVSSAKYQDEPDWSISAKVAYFLGVAAPLATVWYIMTLVGVLVGTSIPQEWGLDFILPITFIGLFAPMLRTLAHLAAAVTSVVVALFFADLPSGMGVLIGAFCAMIVGVLVETWMEKREAQ